MGVVALLDGDPVGWCSVAPRECYSGLERYRALPRIDEAEVWAVVCFLLAPEWRHRGLTTVLLRGAVAYAISLGAQVVEGYPVEPGPRLYTYMGSPRTFLEVGFQDVTPPGASRAVVRYRVGRVSAPASGLGL